jgi:hypothetical protein
VENLHEREKKKMKKERKVEHTLLKATDRSLSSSIRGFERKEIENNMETLDTPPTSVVIM